MMENKWKLPGCSARGQLAHRCWPRLRLRPEQVEVRGFAIENQMERTWNMKWKLMKGDYIGDYTAEYYTGY